MPGECITKIIGPDGESITPMFHVTNWGAGNDIEVWGMTAQGEKMLMGKASYEIKAHELCLFKFENTTPRDQTGLPNHKHVYKSVIEYLFRESCRAPQRNGRVRIDRRCEGALFLWGWGFRVVPTQEKRACLLDEQGLEKPKLFWQQVAEVQPSDVISSTLESLFQSMLDNIANIKIAGKEKELIEAFKHHRLKHILKLIYRANNQIFEERLRAADRNKEVSYIDIEKYELFLPQSTIQEKAGFFNVCLQPCNDRDVESALYMAMHHTHYDGYISEKLKIIFNQLAEKIQIKIGAHEQAVKLNPLQTYYPHQHRWHFYTVEFQGKKGDEAKREILQHACLEIEACQDRQSLKAFKERFIKTEACAILRKSQGFFTQVFKCKTDSIKALEKMIEDASLQV